MDASSKPEIKRGRGRPKTQSNPNIVQSLIDATEELLRENGYHQISERKIAAAAGTHVAMVHYYFGSKDALLFEVVQRYYAEIVEKLKALDKINTDSPSVSRDVFKLITDAYYEKHWIMSMMVAESSRKSSRVMNLFYQKYGEHGVGLLLLKHAVEKLIERGMYDRHADPLQIARAMFYLFTGPFKHERRSISAGLDPEFLKLKDEWVAFVADLFETRYRVSGRSEG